MTPEELEALPGIGEEQVIEKILMAVNAYFGEFDGGQEQVVGEEVVPEEDSSEEAAPEMVAGGDGDGLHEPQEHIEHGPEGDREAVDAADVHLSHAPSELNDSPHPISSVAKGEFDTIEDSENAN